MITLATPWVFGAAVTGALLTTALHLLSVRRPPSLVLPTARFLPDRSVRAVSRTTRPTDLLLLAVRVLAVLMAGLALAGVRWQPTANERGRIVIVDRGQSVGDTSAWHRTVAGILADSANGRSHTRVILVDSTAALLDAPQGVALRADTMSVVRARSSLPAALLVALRGALLLKHDQPRVDSVELVVVSPMARESVDAALTVVRSAWPGRISIVPVATAIAKTEVGVRVLVSGDRGDDPVVAALRALLPAGAVGSTGGVRTTAAGATEMSAVPRGAERPRVVRLLRDSTLPNATQSSTDASANVTVTWPANGAPVGWTHTAPDTIGAIVTGGRALVAPFVREVRAPETLPAQSRVIAWWSDGRAAVVETTRENACDRVVGVRAATDGDAFVGDGARALLAALLAPCGGARDTVVQPTSWRTQLAGDGALARADDMAGGSAPRSSLTPWLLGMALLLLAVEWYARERMS